MASLCSAHWNYSFHRLKSSMPELLSWMISWLHFTDRTAEACVRSENAHPTCHDAVQSQWRYNCSDALVSQWHECIGLMTSYTIHGKTYGTQIVVKERSIATCLSLYSPLPMNDTRRSAGLIWFLWLASNTDGQVCAGIRQSTVDDVVRTKVMWNQPRQRRSYYCVTDVFASTIVCPFSITGKHFGLFHQHGALRPLTLILCLLTVRCLVSFR